MNTVEFIDITELPVTIDFVAVDEHGTPSQDIVFPMYRGAQAVPQVGSRIAGLRGGPWRVRQVLWDFPATSDDAEELSSLLVLVYIYQDHDATERAS